MQTEVYFQKDFLLEFLTKAICACKRTRQSIYRKVPTT